MAQASRHDAWSAGDSYELFMGRWSRKVAPLFLRWLSPPPGKEWLEIGCGTGALSAAILDKADPTCLVAVEPSAGFVEKARQNVSDSRVQFLVGNAERLEFPDASRDVVVSALVLNFVPDRARALQEMKRVLRPRGTMGFYVWDYPGGGQEFIHAFWTAATALNPAAREFNEGLRFPFCTPEALRSSVQEAGYASIEVDALETPTVFRDFDDYWRPFTLGAGPAPGYVANLGDTDRERLRAKLKADLPRSADGSIAMKARAWAVKARKD